MGVVALPGEFDDELCSAFDEFGSAIVVGSADDRCILQYDVDRKLNDVIYLDNVFDLDHIVNFDVLGLVKLIRIVVVLAKLIRIVDVGLVKLIRIVNFVVDLGVDLGIPRCSHFDQLDELNIIFEPKCFRGASIGQRVFKLFGDRYRRRGNRARLVRIRRRRCLPAQCAKPIRPGPNLAKHASRTRRAPQRPALRECPGREPRRPSIQPSGTTREPGTRIRSVTRRVERGPAASRPCGEPARQPAGVSSPSGDSPGFSSPSGGSPGVSSARAGPVRVRSRGRALGWGSVGRAGRSRTRSRRARRCRQCRSSRKELASRAVEAAAEEADLALEMLAHPNSRATS